MLLTLGEERNLMVLENRFLRIIFGLEREEVTVDWRKLHKKELRACKYIFLTQ
jgi:hypothetical protein